MTNRWKQFYEKQIKDAELRSLVDGKVEQISDVTQWFAEPDRLGGDRLLKEGRKQPRMPRRMNI
jgi:hypothetical protein